MVRSADYLVGLVRELIRHPQECEWIEFKVDVAKPSEIGEYISALANSAALADRPHAHLVWGVSNEGHRIVGTKFHPTEAKVGNEQLTNWLNRLLSPAVGFTFHEVVVDDQRLVVLEIERAFRTPVSFEGQDYIRIGSYKKKLKDHAEHERALWHAFSQTRFEDGVAADRVRGEDVVRLLDYPAYFELLKLALPESRDGVLNALHAEGLLSLSPAGGWNISNLGALLFAKKIEEFKGLTRKAIRVIQYRGNDRVQTIREQVGNRGYASGFEGLISYINGLLPTNEIIEQALRKSVPCFPELAVRELVANALIHQDLSVTGAGPMVEIFNDRIEISNPGAPLVDTQRLVDTPPRSRNEVMASLMRRMGICEERGSGWDKVVFETEKYQLPAPLAEAPLGNTRVTLFAPRPLMTMDKEDRVLAVYLHACLQYVNRGFVTNSSVRRRFAIEQQNSAMASRLIRDALDAGVIVLHDAKAAPKLRRYKPFWASSGT